MTQDEFKTQQLKDNVRDDAHEWFDLMESLTWTGGTGKHNPSMTIITLRIQ
jgi:hypothetical protein